jgi:tetratricopeptide (TPR) repeat protein
MLILFLIFFRRVTGGLVAAVYFMMLLAACGQNITFLQGNAAYATGQFDAAAELFADEIKLAPSAEAWHNLGNTEWQRGDRAAAVLAWERVRWINPTDTNAAASLRFARSSASLNVPLLRWWETFSDFLSSNTWAWLAAGSFWLVILVAVVLPVTLRWRRTSWSQSLVAFGLGIFLLALTGAYGVQTRTRLVVVSVPSAALLQAPAAHAPVVSKLNAGDVARTEFARGNYLFVRTGTGDFGWLEKSQLSRIASQ